MPYVSDAQRKAVWASRNERKKKKKKKKSVAKKFEMKPAPFKVRKTEKGASLKRGFKEKWIDVRTGKPCGRSEGEKRGVPYCRPSKRISSKTPKTSGEMSKSEKAKKIREKKALGQPKGKPRRVKPVK